MQRVMMFNLKRESYEEKKKELRQIQEEIIEIKKEIGVFNTKKSELEGTVKKGEGIEKSYRDVRKRIEVLGEQEKRDAIVYATAEKEKENLQKIREKVVAEIQQKEKTREKINKLKNLQNWLENQFINIVAAMEKQMMLRIHTDFNAFFQKWFEMLVDAEKMRVRIDEEFSPVIEQSGYSIEYNHLSGGEKTAVALAYRLALNQIMNTLMSTIKTRNLLILDEPTDGFSSEQLDRLRNVLDELDAKQIIMVSHESKIESFVQNVLRLEKREHVSSLIYE